MRHPPSLWLADNTPSHPPLRDDTSCDVAVIGAGIAGLSAAWHLAQRGAQVVLLERGTVASGSTGRSGGFLAQSSAYDLATLQDTLGEARGLDVYRSIVGAIDRMADTVRAESIDCELSRTGAFYCAAEPSHRTIVMREHDALSRSGFPCESVAGDRLPVAGIAAAIRTAGDYALDPARFARGLASSLARRAAVHEHTTVSGIRRTGTQTHILTATGARIRADHVVLATGGWHLASGMRALAVPFTSYIAVTEPVSAEVTARLGDALLWDTYEIYHYLRRLPDGRILIGGNDSILATFGISTINRAGGRLLTVLRRFFPGTEFRLQAAWGGRIALPPDGFPVVETNGNRTMLITDSLPLGWIIGRMAADRIRTGGSEYDDLFDVGRDMGIAGNLLRSLPLPRSLKIAAMRAGLAATLVRSALDERFFR